MKTPPSPMPLLAAPIWKRKIALTSQDPEWLGVCKNTLLAPLRSVGLEAIRLADGKRLWALTKGRQRNTAPFMLWDRVCLKTPKDTALMLSCQDGKAKGSFPHWHCYPFEASGERFVACGQSIRAMENQDVVASVRKDRGGVRNAFNNCVLWEEVYSHAEPGKNFWVCSRLESGRLRELWRSPRGKMGELKALYPDGKAIFEKSLRERRGYPGCEQEENSVELKVIEAGKGKGVLWEMVVRSFSSSIFRVGDIIFHACQIFGEKGIYQVIAQDINSGKIVWKKNADPMCFKKLGISTGPLSYCYAVAVGDGRLWVRHASQQSAGKREACCVIAYDPQNGKETMAIKLPGKALDNYEFVEHDGILVVLWNKILHAYKLPKSEGDA